MNKPVCSFYQLYITACWSVAVLPTFSHPFVIQTAPSLYPFNYRTKKKRSIRISKSCSGTGTGTGGTGAGAGAGAGEDVGIDTGAGVLTGACTSPSSEKVVETKINDNLMMMMTTLPQYLKEKQVGEELMNVICAAATACVDISQELQRLPIRNYNNNNNNNYLSQQKDDDERERAVKRNVQGEVQKEMDVIANEMFIDKVKDKVVVMTSEEEEDIIKGKLWDYFYSKDIFGDDLPENMENIVEVLGR